MKWTKEAPKKISGPEWYWIRPNPEVYPNLPAPVAEPRMVGVYMSDQLWFEDYVNQERYRVIESKGYLWAGPIIAPSLDEAANLTNSTMSECLQFMREAGAGIYQQIIKNGDDKPEAAIIIVDGAEESEAVLAAVDEVSKDW